MPDFRKALLDNKKKNFVQRALFPYIHPVMHNKDGSVSTHSMADAEADGRYFAYPTVVQGSDGELMRLGRKEAFRHAMDTGEFIEFSSQEDASEFAKGGYKKAAGWKDQRPPQLELE